MLSDDVLLEIFDIYVNKNADEYSKKEIEKWQTLVHVCCRWRSIVIGSPRRLNLRLVCASVKPARDMLDIWPSLPLLIRDTNSTDISEILAALERSDRVVQIHLIHIDGSKLETVLAAMQVPFPELTRLVLYPEDRMEPDLPDSFLGGSAPFLQSLWLERIPFPGLPKLLLSATHLVTLRLWNIPHSGYFSPEAIVTALSTLTSLEYLSLEFKSPLSRPDWANRRLPPPTRSVLPILIYFSFKGVCEYLEDLVACIDTPRLNELFISLFNQIIFDTPQSIQFISRAPMLETFEKAYVVFGSNAAWVHLSSQKSVNGNLVMKIPCIELDWQVSAMEQVCTSCIPPLSQLESLYICEHPYLHPVWKNNIENTLWLELLRPFTGVKNLYLSYYFESRVIRALKKLTRRRMTEVLPILQNIFLESLQSSGTVQAGVQRFISTRQDAGHPIAVSCWDDPMYGLHAIYEGILF